MRNRAKCKKCQCIIESFHRYDLVSCKCGSISVSGGNEKLEAMADDWVNFLRVDDEGNEIIVKVKEEITLNEPIQKSGQEKPTKRELLSILDEMIKNIENLPQSAMLTPITHYDFASSLILISSILRSE